MTNLEHVLITGASTGIGLELARLFAADGRSLVLVARGAERLQFVSEEIQREFGVEVVSIPLDLTSPNAVTELIARCKEQGAGIACLINNAGFGSYGPFGEHDPLLYRKMIDLNVGVLTELAASLLPAMKEAAEDKSRGKDQSPLGIMNVASTAAFQPGPSMAVYFATKSYVLSFSEALHEELQGSGVLACAFCPGPTKTEFFTTESMIPTGNITDADRAKFAQRDAKRMKPQLAAQLGYEGFRAGDAIVVPGLKNSVLSQASRFLPRLLIRKIVKRMLAK